MAQADAAIWGAARSLLEWHARHPFCALCGQRSTTHRVFGTRTSLCTCFHQNFSYRSIFSAGTSDVSAIL